MAIYVVNKKQFSGEDVYVGRPSVLGNLFAIGRDGDRAEVIGKYRVRLWKQVKARGKVFEELVKIKRKAETEERDRSCRNRSGRNPPRFGSRFGRTRSASCRRSG